MKTKIFFLLIAFLGSATSVFAQLEFLQMPAVDNEIQTFPTFNSCSYYYRSSDDAAFRVEYKRTDETGWHVAHRTICDQPEKIHKGSLFNLNEDTEYQVRILTVNDNKVITQATFNTWSSTPYIAQTIDLSTLLTTSQDGIVITAQGAPGAWIKYTAPADWTVRRTFRSNDTQEACIVLKDAKYIILENLTIEGGRPHGILVENCDYVRILNCDISSWGNQGVQQFINGERCGQYKDTEGKWISYEGGVNIHKSYATVVERCYIHDPAGRANSWVFSHPSGPQAILANYTRGGNVIRWNDFVGSDEHRWNDVMEGIANFTTDGGLFRDSDIFGNYLAFGNDDGIELEGGGMNLRFIGNKIEGTACGISFGASMIGPQYAIGNLLVNLGDEEGFALKYFKNSHGNRQIGKRLIYNNTIHDFNLSAASYDNYGPATPVDAGLGTMRNNIFVCMDSRAPGEWARFENFDNDLFWINSSHAASERLITGFHNIGQEKNALIVDPQLVDPLAGNYRLAPASPARSKAAEVTGVIGAGDDPGAFTSGVTEIPLRPLAFTASPGCIHIEATGGAATVTLSLPADAPSPVAFHIRQNKVFDWFAVTPASGTLSPGKTLTLTVSIDAASISGRPNFRGAFLVRTANGLSRPVTVYAKGNYTEDKHPASAPNTVYLTPSSGAINTQIDVPQNGYYCVLARIVRVPRVITNAPPQNSGQRFEILINGQSSPLTASTGDWYIKDDVERVLFLSSLGELKSGANLIDLKSNNPRLTVIEYIITDNPAAFFYQGRNVQ